MSPMSVRGIFVTINKLLITFGIMVNFLFLYTIQHDPIM